MGSGVESGGSLDDIKDVIQRAIQDATADLGGGGSQLSRHAHHLSAMSRALSE